MGKRKSYFTDGKVRVISSSHNDIAFLDTPLATIIFRNKNVIKKAIAMIEEDPEFRHTIENSLYLKDFILLNTKDKERLSSVMRDNKLACGATYTQLYETTVSSEGLVRQYYLGKRWLEKEFPGFETKTTWNQDVPARTMQSAQIMKKCGVDYLFVSRMNAGFFKWFSPDGSYVSGYCTGHYHQNSISQIIDLDYNVYEENSIKASLNSEVVEDLSYDKEGHQKIFDYMEESAKSTYKEKKIPPFFGFLAIRDYDYPLNLDNYFEGFDKNSELDFPKFANATAEEFMDHAIKVIDKDSYWNEYHGERPNLWIYHAISHSKAFYYNRNGLNIIDEVELFASLQQLLNIKCKYPTSDIREVWEQLLYLDHGWGGYNGHVTDKTYLEVSKKGYENSKRLLIDQLTNLSANIKVEEEASFITIFNASAWERKDKVISLIDWRKLGSIDFEIRDSKNQIVEYQIIEEPLPYTIKIII